MTLAGIGQLNIFWVSAPHMFIDATNVVEHTLTCSREQWSPGQVEVLMHHQCILKYSWHLIINFTTHNTGNSEDSAADCCLCNPCTQSYMDSINIYSIYRSGPHNELCVEVWA